MSEYIVDLPDSGAADEAVKRFGVDDSRLYGYQLTGEIVRCRDCKHGYKDVCERPIWDDGDRACTPIEPDGFCAWGERKEGGDD